MARATAKKADKNINQAELLFEPKRDINPYWSSSLFSDVYLKNDFPREYSHLWKNDENSGFTKFYQGFVDLCVDLQHESFLNWREADTVKNWIVPVMDLLGWENNSKRQQNSYIDNTSFTIEENGKKQVYRPDLIYFDRPEFKSYTQEQKDINEKLREIRSKKTGSQVVVEAKYWDRLSALGDKVKKIQESGDSASSLGPELQTLKYMDLFHLDYGILTDGKTWKLLHRELSQGIPNRSYEFDLGPLMELALKLGTENNEAKFSEYAKYFYFFFAKESFCETKLLDKVLEYSKKYASRIEEDLRERFIISMGVICNSLKDSADGLKVPYTLDLIRNVAESHLFNILFVKSCEVRHILPVKSPNYIKISLHEVIESLGQMEFDPAKNLDTFLKDFQFGSTFGGKKFDWNGFEIFDRFINLYEIIHDGTNPRKDFGFEIQGFKESIFSTDEWKFAKKAKICNENMVKILFNLNFIKSEFPQRKYQQIPYSYFTPRQLGSIYESFLEFKLKEAPSDLIFNCNEWKEGNPNSRKVIEMNLSKGCIVKKGDLFFDADNVDRKKTGSYYTPDYIVSYIIEKSVAPFLEEIKTSKQLLELKICDPAMGSGHFLSGVLDYLTRVYREKLSNEMMDDLTESFAQSARKILDSCIFGVDLNPRAVKLAKMSLWLSTAETSLKLENLEDQLKNFDSLKANWKREFPLVFSRGGFDCIVGNPPYGAVVDEEYKIGAAKKLKSSIPSVDSFILFLLRSFEIVNSSGRVGYIVPSTWLYMPTYKIFREKMFQPRYVESLVHFKEPVFEDAVVETLLVFGDKIPNKNELSYKVISGEPSSFQGSDMPISYTSLLSSEDLAVRPISSELENNLFNHVRDISAELGSMCEVVCGLTPYRLGKGKPKQTEKIVQNKMYDSNHKKDKTYRQYVMGRDFFRFSWNLKEQRWISYGDWLAEPRYAAPYDDSKKIVVRQTASTIIANLDECKYLNLKNVHNVKILDENISYEYLLGLLNSELISWWYSKLIPEKGRVFAEVKAINLRKLPILIPKSNAELKLKEKIENLVRDLLDLSSQSNMTNRFVKKFDELNENVNALYKLSSKDSIAINKDVKDAYSYLQEESQSKKLKEAS